MLKYLTTCLASRGDNYAAAGEGEEESKEEESGIETISRESQEIRCRQRKMGEKEGRGGQSCSGGMRFSTVLAKVGPLN